MLGVGLVDFDTAAGDDFDFKFVGINDPAGLARQVAELQRAAMQGHTEPADPARRVGTPGPVCAGSSRHSRSGRASPLCAAPAGAAIRAFRTSDGSEDPAFVRLGARTRVDHVVADGSQGVYLLGRIIVNGGARQIVHLRRDRHGRSRVPALHPGRPRRRRRAAPGRARADRDVHVDRRPRAQPRRGPRRGTRVARSPGSRSCPARRASTASARSRSRAGRSSSAATARSSPGAPGAAQTAWARALPVRADRALEGEDLGRRDDAAARHAARVDRPRRRSHARSAEARMSPRPGAASGRRAADRAQPGRVLAGRPSRRHPPRRPAARRTAVECGTRRDALAGDADTLYVGGLADLVRRGRQRSRA